METDLLSLLLRINLVLAVAIALVLVLRAPVRRWCGARVAYALWMLPLVAAAMCFAPARTEHIVLEASAFPVTAAASAPEPPYLVWAWASGALLSLIILAARQWRFTHALGRLHARDDLGANVRAAESSTHGPAVLGVLRPLIITPADFEARFDAEEQRIVLAHERAHMAQGDPIINAIVVVLQCVNWFNPLIHLGARALRLDQELACDAAVLERAGPMRRRYAEAMLKTHVAAAAPLGCAWPPANLNALKERISMLKQTLPSRTQRLLGGVAIVSITAAAAAAAWAAQPAQVITSFAATAPSVITHEVTLEGGERERVEIRTEGDERDMRRVVIRNGEVISERELTAEEREQVRRAIVQADHGARMAAEAAIDAEEIAAHVEAALANVDMEAAMAAIEHIDIAATVEHALAAVDSADLSELTPAQREEVRVAMAEARREMSEARVQAELNREQQAAVREAMAEARREMAEARREAARARVEAAHDARIAIDEARVEIRREAAEARAEGDTRRAEELERAAQSLERGVRVHRERTEH